MSNADGHRRDGVGHHAVEAHKSQQEAESSKRRYSHILIDAKRQALDALDEQRGRVLPEASSQ